MKKRADRFVVGYSGTKGYAYGEDFGHNVMSMTRRQAEKRVKDLASGGADRIIYELVEVKRIKGDKK